MALSFDNTYRSKAALALSELYEGGTVVIRNSSNGTLATVTVPDPAFEGKSAGTAGLIAELTATVTTSGTAHNYVANLPGGGTEAGTIGTSGADMIVDNLNLVQGGIVRITVWNNTYPAVG
jgi:hypothetical protein